MKEVQIFDSKTAGICIRILNKCIYIVIFESTQDGLLKNECFQDETVKEGQELFLNFFQEQLQKAGIDEPVIAEEEQVQ